AASRRVSNITTRRWGMRSFAFFPTNSRIPAQVQMALLYRTAQPAVRQHLAAAAASGHPTVRGLPGHRRTVAAANLDLQPHHRRAGGPYRRGPLLLAHVRDG